MTPIKGRIWRTNRMREKREQEKENSQAPQSNIKNKSYKHEEKSDNSNQLTIYVSPSVQPLLQ